MERRFDLVVDSRPFGGTCALRGCVPKKILVGAAEPVSAARDMADMGVPAATLMLDWPPLMRFKRSVVDPTPRRTEETWAKVGIEQSVSNPAVYAGGDAAAIGPRRRGVESGTEVC